MSKEASNMTDEEKLQRRLQYQIQTIEIAIISKTGKFDHPIAQVSTDAELKVMIDGLRIIRAMYAAGHPKKEEAPVKTVADVDYCDSCSVAANEKQQEIIFKKNNGKTLFSTGDVWLCPACYGDFRREVFSSKYIF